MEAEVPTGAAAGPPPEGTEPARAGQGAADAAAPAPATMPMTARKGTDKQGTPAAPALTGVKVEATPESGCTNHSSDADPGPVPSEEDQRVRAAVNAMLPDIVQHVLNLVEHRSGKSSLGKRTRARETNAPGMRKQGAGVPAATSVLPVPPRNKPDRVG